MRLLDRRTGRGAWIAVDLVREPNVPCVGAHWHLDMPGTRHKEIILRPLPTLALRLVIWPPARQRSTT